MRTTLEPLKSAELNTEPDWSINVNEGSVLMLVLDSLGAGIW